MISEDATSSQKPTTGASSASSKFRTNELFLVFFLTAFFVSCLLIITNVFCIQELQTINSRFEVRPWLLWSKESLRRLNPSALWQYHQKHEIPCDWRHWDYTLSWLIENNHPPVINRFVLFNHKVEDEPPEEAIKQHEWMAPLRQVPVARATLSRVIDFLTAAGARMIILDRDFPQFSPDDASLAAAIYRAGSASPPVPVLMARTISHTNSGNLVGALVPTKPSGVLEALSRLATGANVINKYTGTVDMLPDRDQVVRRINLRHLETETQEESIVLKALAYLGNKNLSSCPPEIDIDFSAPPDSELYPIRPFSYLLDPEIKKSLLDPQPGNNDVRIKGAIVVLGDSITDVLETPLTNNDLNSRSGAEILVHAAETVSRGRWPQRLPALNCFGIDFPAFDLLYAFFVSLAGALLWVFWESCASKSFPAPAFSKSITSSLLLDLMALLALSMGAIAAAFWEREREKEDKYRSQLKAAEDRVELIAAKYEAELAREKAEARARQSINDQLRRNDFVQRLNHDLNTPVGVLNWTLYEFSEMKDLSPELKEKVDRLIRNSEKLQELIAMIAQSYEYTVKPEEDPTGGGSANLSSVLSNCLDLQKPYALSLHCDLSWSLPKETMWVKAHAVDLSRIFDNLVRNALKHNPINTRVELIGESGNTNHKIRVVDNGRGIAACDLEHIFEPGYSVSSSAETGQGLGLDIVRTLVDKIGGNICVSSKEGQGSEFTVTLPTLSPPETGP